ncbi:MAG: hypothetical protein DRN04_01965 [Thermoprotei archaeon]|nr:MAG: hypothetical protein DRN04_01965 [Thermoprotei archaeon]
MIYTPVSAKINRGLYLKLKKYNISFSINRIIKRVLEEKVRKREEEEIKETLKKVQEILKEIPSSELVKVIRMSREEK